MMKKQCRSCGRDFYVPKKRVGNQQAYCSPKCRPSCYRPKYGADRPCVDCGDTVFHSSQSRGEPRCNICRQAKAKERNAARSTAGGLCVCRDCGVSFYCERQKRKVCDLCRLVKKVVGLYCTLPRECPTCKATFKPIQLNAEYCSKLCKDRSSKEYERVLANRRARGVKPKPRAKPATYTTHRHQCNLCSVWFWSTHTKRVRCDECVGITSLAKVGLLIKSCVACGASFKPKATKGGVTDYCSASCRSAAAKANKRKHRRERRRKHGNASTHRKRARLAGVEYEPISVQKVMERDGWRCQICGRATPKKFRGSCRPNAPELDHVVPLAMGGPHKYINVQCACRECNARKGGDSVAGQMPLFQVAA